MLAYLFWHRPKTDVETGAYERYLTGFHETLATTDVDGFQGSATFRIEGASWMGSGRQVYEDWYLLDGSYAMDPLNEAAVSGARKEPHDAAAHAATDGAGGLYQLKSGGPGVAAQNAFWFSKPAGVGYPEFYERLETWTEDPNSSLWRRQMVLGPAPEFCLLASKNIQLPSDMEPVAVERSRVWP